jgi:hypothetical protein
MVRDVWSFYESLFGRDRSGLTPAERDVAAICDLRQEVNSDGLVGYFSYWGGNTAVVALAALPGVLGPAWADLLREAMALLGSDYPAEAVDRFDRIEAPGVWDTLAELDARFYALEESVDADALLTEYLGRAG